MPTLETIAGEQVVNLSPREAFEFSLNGEVPQSTESINAIYDEVVAGYQTEDLDFNTFPIPVFDKKYVLARGTLSDRELKVALDIGHVVCDPSPNPIHGARINGSSIDVTMGKYFFTAGKHEGSGMFNPFSQEDTYRYFDISNPETDYKEAKPWGEVKAKLGFRAIRNLESLEMIEGIPEDHPMILLRPNERILTHTHEFIGMRPPGTTSMQARSTTGRIGLSACYCAGWGDPGYVNRWTMEVHNLNENEYLPVPVGFRIAQVIFSMTGPVGTEYSKATGNYQQDDSADMGIIKQAWRPHFVLPKAYNNEIMLPTPVEGLSNGLS